MSQISISIDLSGSTYAKHKIVQKTEPSLPERAELYNDYLKILYQLERSFYDYVLSDPLLKLDRIYLLKIIGDEYWFMYDIQESDHEHSSPVFALFNALANLIAEDRLLPISVSSSGIRNNNGNRTLNLPIKIFIDLLDEAQELNNLRYEYLKGTVARASGGSSTVYKIDERYVDICNRLNLGSPDLRQKGHPVHGRMDLIGFQVDRFFRLTKFCRPNILTVGDKLFQSLDLEPLPLHGGLEGIAVKTVRIGNPGLQKTDEKYVVPELIAGTEMKGIGENYRIHHIFGQRSLGEAAYGPVPDTESLMEETRAFLAESGFYAIDRDRLLL